VALLDEHGNSLKSGGKLASGAEKKHTNVGENVFEGVVQIKIYMDAIEGKGKCLHCSGIIEGALRFPKGYSLTRAADREERQQDAKRQLYDKLKRDHYCIPRIDGPKLPVLDFLKRFE
jgi:hypothetical protein